MACDVVVAGRLPAAQSTGAFGDGATESLSKTMIRYSRKVEGAEVSAVYSSKWIAGLAGRWDRNRTCNLRFWSTRRSVQIRPGTSNIALNSLISATHRPAASKHVQPLCSQFCSQVQHGERFKATGRSNVTWMPLWRAGHRDFARSNDVPYVWNQLSWLVHTVAPVH